MVYILHIDTSTTTASLWLSCDGQLTGQSQNHQQQDHAAWIQPAIVQLLESAGIKPAELSAVALTAGPGSYTGLRVAMATAKGLCYALQIPMITHGTLEIMAASCISQLQEQIKSKTLIVPMIDARRMEVFTAIYDSEGRELLAPTAMILDQDSFKTELEDSNIIFFGNGSAKFGEICKHPNARFVEVFIDGNSFIRSSYDKFLRSEFTALAYSEPAYLKDFYIHPKL